MKYWLYSSIVMCVVDFIKSYRISKYRKYVDNQVEIVRATMNIFLPIYRLVILISNLSIIFKPKEYCELLGMIEDMEVLSKEKEGSNE